MNLKKKITKNKTMKKINYLKAYNAIFDVSSILSNEKEDMKTRVDKAFQILSGDMIKAFCVMRDMFESDADIITAVELLDYAFQFPDDANSPNCFGRAADIFRQLANNIPSDLGIHIWLDDNSYYFDDVCDDAIKHHREVMARMLSYAKLGLTKGGRIVACWEISWESGDNAFINEDVTGLEVDDAARLIFSDSNIFKVLNMLRHTIAEIDTISFYFTIYRPDGECLGNTFVDTFDVTEDIFQHKMEKHAAEIGIFDDKEEETPFNEMPF